MTVKSPKDYQIGYVDGVKSGILETVDNAIAIIEDYDLYKRDEDGDMVACRSEILGEILALKGGAE